MWLCKVKVSIFIYEAARLILNDYYLQIEFVVESITLLNFILQLYLVNEFTHYFY